MRKIEFSILITTKNRVEDLKLTLKKTSHFFDRVDVECIICDDGSTDGTSSFLEREYPNIILIKNRSSKGLIYSRNRLLNLTQATYAITLDDDAHFETNEPLKRISNFFEVNNSCAVIAFRIFWGTTLPGDLSHELTNRRVKGFVGCGHVWRMDAWRTIPNYPDWFVFYGEEEFASFQLFLKKWEIWFVPDILVQHRVDVQSRKQNKDYTIRLRRSLRSGWYLYMLFYPLSKIPKKFLYTLWIQLKLKVFKGDVKALLAIIMAIFDLTINFPKLLLQRKALNKGQYDKFINLAETPIYWQTLNRL